MNVCWVTTLIDGSGRQLIGSLPTGVDGYMVVSAPIGIPAFDDGSTNLAETTGSATSPTSLCLPNDMRWSPLRITAMKASATR